MPNSIKQIIDDHPLVTLVSVVVATAGVAAGGAGWLGGQRITALEEQLKVAREQGREQISRAQEEGRLRLAEQALAARAEREQTEARLREEAQNLSIRLTSIERRMGDQKQYLDVVGMFVRQADLPQLRRGRFEAYAEGTFFASTPPDPRWRRVPGAGEFDVIAQTMGPQFVEAFFAGAPPAVRAEINRLAGVAWFGPALPTLRLPVQQRPAPVGFDLRPAVFIARLTQASLMQRYAAVIQMVGGAAEPLAPAGRSANPGLGGALTRAAAAKKEARSPDLTDALQDATEELARAARGDIAGAMVTDALFSRFTRCATVLRNCSFSVSSLQKVGNIFYLRTRTSVRADGSERDASRARVHLDEEIIFLTRPSDTSEALLIRTFLPSFDGNPDSAAWVASLLASLHVPI